MRSAQGCRVAAGGLGVAGVELDGDEAGPREAQRVARDGEADVRAEVEDPARVGDLRRRRMDVVAERVADHDRVGGVRPELDARAAERVDADGHGVRLRPAALDAQVGEHVGRELDGVADALDVEVGAVGEVVEPREAPGVVVPGAPEMVGPGAGGAGHRRVDVRARPRTRVRRGGSGSAPRASGAGRCG